jgi:alcohol dehydrogenase class IV
MFKGRIPQLEFGNGMLVKIGDIAKQFGTTAILTIDPFLDSSGISSKVAESLSKAGITTIKCTDIEPNPSCFKIDKAGVLARENGAEMVIAVGGGSAIDFGKAVAVVSINAGASWDYTERADHQIRRPDKVLPIIAVPTTSGTGSETTPFSVLNNTEIKEKSTIVSDAIYPRSILIDPELMYTMPRRLTASTGFDAFAHCLESYISLAATPFSRMVAREGMKIIVENLPKAVANGENREARANMAWGSALGGSAISSIGVVLPHSLGQPVGGFCGAPHGESVAACMVEVLKMSYTSNMQIFADISDILEPSIAAAPLRKRAETCPELVQQFLNDIDLYVRYSDFGLTRQDIDKVTNIALTGYYFDIKCHPRKVGEKDINALYERSL